MAKNGSNKILITIVVILIITLLGGSAAAFWYLNKIDTAQTQLNKQEQNSTHETLTKIGPLYPLKPFSVNLKTANGKDVYLKATLTLELDYKALSKELDAKNDIIRDNIIMILSNQTAESITSDIGKSKICNKIKTNLNSILTDGQIRNVYIVNFKILTID